MKHAKHLLSPALVLAMVALFFATPATNAGGDKLGPYQQIATVKVPSGLVGGFDISWVDSETGNYYLADRGDSTATPPVSPGIDVIDTKHPAFLFEIQMPTGPNGILVFHGGNNDKGAGTLVAGGNDSNTYFIDLANPSAAPIVVPTGGQVRADELAYDPVDQIILITNPDEATPFVTFISAATHAKLGTIIYDGNPGDGHGPNATAGLEQPVWDGVTGKFYINIPATPENPLGELDVIDPTTRTVTLRFSTPCSPVPPLGLTLVPGPRLVNSCGDVFDIQTQTIVQTQTGIFADEIWYNSGDQRVYFGSFTSTPVVDGIEPYEVIPGGLPWTGSFPTLFSHSVAVDSVYNHSFVPVSNTGVLVFTDDHDYGKGPPSN
jgi:hypothetical protein